MKYNIRGSKLEVTDSIKNYIETKLNKLNKYFENPEDITATVLIKTQGIDQKVEVTIPIKKIILRSEEVQKDLYASIDIVTDKLERQIRKNKTRLKARNTKDKTFIMTDFEVSNNEDSSNKIIKRKKLELKPMNEEEAILQMNLIDHNFFVFQNSETGLINVLYLRKDNNYGIIEMKED